MGSSVPEHVGAAGGATRRVRTEKPCPQLAVPMESLQGSLGNATAEGFDVDRSRPGMTRRASAMRSHALIQGAHFAPANTRLVAGCSGHDACLTEQSLLPHDDWIFGGEVVNEGKQLGQPVCGRCSEVNLGCSQCNLVRSEIPKRVPHRRHRRDALDGM